MELFAAPGVAPANICAKLGCPGGRAIKEGRGDDRREARGKQTRTHRRGLWSVKGFTLMELMVVVIIIGVIAAFAIPNYSKSIQKAHERDMLVQLTSIHASNLLYRSYDGKYWNTAEWMGIWRDQQRFVD